jgi:hypothetical protein
VAFVRGCLAPRTTAAGPWDAAGAVADTLASVAVCVADRGPLVRGPPWAARGGQAGHPALVAAVAGRWHAGREAST